MISHGTYDRALRTSLSFCFKLITMALLCKIAWVSVGVSVSVNAFSYQGVPKGGARIENYSTKSRVFGEINSDFKKNFKNELGRSLLNSPTGATTTVINECSDLNSYSPPEWNELPTEVKAKLANLLTWDNLSKWEFNIFEVAELTNDPLLLVGWALLCEPMAQEAMQTSLEVKGDADDYSNGCVSGGNINTFRYQFHEHLEIDAQTICNFLREIERRYNRDIPFHNSVHAADVAQTTHCLFQMMDQECLTSIFDPITIFSLILAATFHDVCHPGTSNLFQQNAQTSIAVKYNNMSVLENMHLTVGLSLLFGNEKRDEWSVFEGWADDDRARAEEIMKESILNTDMAHHFANLDHLESLIEQVHTMAKDITEEHGNNAEIGGPQPQPILSILAQISHQVKSGLGGGLAQIELEGKCNQLVGSIAELILHGADISNPAKTEVIALNWGRRCFDEFFEQGDKEKEMGLPISPLCDRNTVKRQEGHFVFTDLFAEPTYELLGNIIPRVKEEVLPHIIRTKGILGTMEE